MYIDFNPKNKKELKEKVARYNNAVKSGDDSEAAKNEVRVFAPGLGTPQENGWETVEGPHYPKPHRWYSQVLVKDGLVVQVK